MTLALLSAMPDDGWPVLAVALSGKVYPELLSIGQPLTRISLPFWYGMLMMVPGVVAVLVGGDVVWLNRHEAR